MEQLDDIITLAEAAAELELAPVTLRAAVTRGKLRARLIGKTYVTTRDEVERYRRDSLGQRGRPALEHRPPVGDAPTELEHVPGRTRKWSDVKRQKGAP